MFRFTCNVCCAECAVASTKELERENITCQSCGSTVRFRWMVHALSTELFGKSLPLPQFPEQRSLRGIGMSDWETLAAGLRERFDFRNTFLHADPKLDLLHPGVMDWAAYDFVLASEVFEHIPPPIQRAFDNLARILRPKGFVVFTVPWKPEGETEEHYPSLHDWRTEQSETGERVLVNRTRDNKSEVFRNLLFHGGGGRHSRCVFSRGRISCGDCAKRVSRTLRSPVLKKSRSSASCGKATSRLA